MMNLQEKNAENIQFILDKIKDKLQVVNGGALLPENFDINKYENLLDLFYMIDKKTSFSVSEIEAIIKELGSLRK